MDCRIYVEKKARFKIEAEELRREFSQFSKSINEVFVYTIYDVFGLIENHLSQLKERIFSEPAVDNIYEREEIESRLNLGEYFAVEYLPGQFDQRADSAEQCIQLLTGQSSKVRSGKLIVIAGVTYEELTEIKNYHINKIEMREKDLSVIKEIEVRKHTEIEIFENFTTLTSNELSVFRKKLNLAMNQKDLEFIKEYFSNIEKRNPTETEIRVLDTYWSDHCRHTTFLTTLKSITFSNGILKENMISTYNNYLKSRELVHEKQKDICLMDMATIVMKEMRKNGLLEELDESDEINACTVKVKVDVEGELQDWLLLFKNETHNHPTEIEPFGGAATCIGGAIRDPLSGRAYVYQAMRISGCANPLEDIENTISGKLPQKVITKRAAQGFSSYGNQIGLATSFVKEIYHEGYKAKRMELGAVVGAVPAQNVKREKLKAGDLIVILGGRTGRDGIGGASGSSKVHTTASIVEAGAEVQKGNAPEERKLQRLFRNPTFSRMVKKCNDFGAGGVAVAIGELASGVYIDLNIVPLKYEGLTGTEIAISESQERMAVVIDRENKDEVMRLAKEENLEATIVGEITDNDRLIMMWNGNKIVDIERSFLDTNGVKNESDVVVSCDSRENLFKRHVEGDTFKEKVLNNLRMLNVCSQKGLSEMFDSTIGAGTVFMPFGGKFQQTETEGSVHLFPVLNSKTNTASAITYGYNPDIATANPYLGGMYAIIEALSKLVAMGVSYNAHLTMQEYFQRMITKEDWGKPFSAMLGIIEAQKQFKIAAIGGKDSMSGTFENLSVPPTVVAFAVNTTNAKTTISSEFKREGSYVYLLQHTPKENGMPDFLQIKSNFEFLLKQNAKGNVLSAMSVKSGGIAETICKMTFGNKIGFDLMKYSIVNESFDLSYGSIIWESSALLDNIELAENPECKVVCIGMTGGNSIKFADVIIGINEAISAWSDTLEGVFPTKCQETQEQLEDIRYIEKAPKFSSNKIFMPRVAIPVFPGTNCEYDTEHVFNKAGGDTNIVPFRCQNADEIKESIDAFEVFIDNCEILVLSGGFSAGDEPDGSGKYISIFLENERIREAIEKLLYRDGLIVGICNGFQALIKSGLLPFGKIGSTNELSPTLARNDIGRHISKMVRTKVVSNLSPWYNDIPIGTTHIVPVSHGEGKFVADIDTINKLLGNGQIATRYVDFDGKPTMAQEFNPNGSIFAIEGITDQSGRVLGKMGHSERFRDNIYRNLPGVEEERIFASGIKYFR